MSEIRLQGISCRKLERLDLSVATGESVAILGSSGAGKSTLLKVIAGLLPHTGQLSFDGVSVASLSAHQRDLGYLSQDLHLFPHLTIASNLRLALLFGFDQRGTRTQRINEALRLTQASHLAKRYPRHLSGGERQRAALARCLVRQPTLLLLDEPFCSLDRETKLALWQDLNHLRRRLAITMLIVTHDPQEAEVLADRTVYLSDGQLYNSVEKAQAITI